MKLKTLLWIAIVTILVFSSVESGFTFQNEPEGFRGLKWGDPPTESMEYLGTFQGDRIYTLSDDKMSMGNVELHLIVYAFHCGIEDARLTTLKDQSERFMLVVLGFWKEGNFDLLKTICQGKFGEETQEDFFELDWQGQKALITLHI